MMMTWRADELRCVDSEETVAHRPFAFYEYAILGTLNDKSLRLALRVPDFFSTIVLLCHTFPRSIRLEICPHCNGCYGIHRNVYAHASTVAGCCTKANRETAEHSWAGM